MGRVPGLPVLDHEVGRSIRRSTEYPALLDIGFYDAKWVFDHELSRCRLPHWGLKKVEALHHRSETGIQAASTNGQMMSIRISNTMSRALRGNPEDLLRGVARAMASKILSSPISQTP